LLFGDNVSGKSKKKSVGQEYGNIASPAEPTAALPESGRYRPAGLRFWLPLSIVVFVLSCGFLFFHLGHYPLWVDEADTAIFARGIARTGDTSALIDHNLYAYHLGALLKNLHGRHQPPVPYYLAAPFVGASGTSSLWPRIPFAICGILSVAVLLYWMSRSRLSRITWIVMSIGLLCNVEFFLYCRQCRYYSLTILLSLAIAYLYLNWKGSSWKLAGIVLASILLLGTNELSYAALYAVLGCDYLLFARRERRLTIRQWFLLLAPQILAGILIIWIYNPLEAGLAPDTPRQNLIIDKLTTIWWNFRDLNDCEFCVGIVMLAGLPVYFWKRNVWLLRGLIAVVCYCVAAAIVAPCHLAWERFADVRFLVPLIPLCIGISTMVIVTLTRGRWYFTLPLVVAVFGFNFLNYPFFPSRWCCRPAEFIGELWSPRDTSIDVAVKWIDDHVRKGESICVSPGLYEPSFMYHAPDPIYAWHLKYPPKGQFESLPPIHFFSTLPPPDYFVAFGPQKESIDKLIISMKDQGVDYNLIEVLDIYWKDYTRPEIFWRSFRPIKNFDRQTEAVYVYRRVTP
jgi:hypothetical protein